MVGMHDRVRVLIALTSIVSDPIESPVEDDDFDDEISCWRRLSASRNNHRAEIRHTAAYLLTFWGFFLSGDQKKKRRMRMNKKKTIGTGCE